MRLSHNGLAEPTLRHAPDHPWPLPQLAFLEWLRSARRGSAAGPSGATNAEHLRILLDMKDSRLLHGPELQPLLPYARQ